MNFYDLTPEIVLASLEAGGFEPTGAILQLNSYENRVFEIELEGHQKVIAKFYRPQRWSRDTILEEHEFLREIEAAGIHTAPAIILPNDSTVMETDEIYWSIFPKIQGRLMQEVLPRDLERIGRSLAHIHNIGAQKPAKHRVRLDVPSYGEPSLDLLKKWVVPELWSRYADTANTLLDRLDDLLEDANYIRIHGDCHRGNLLDSGKELFFVDFDDFCNGPVAQDLWMLTAGDPEEHEKNLDAILKGYEELREFDSQELELFEPLRGLRLLHYSAWIARRWEDPSFPKLFPEFGTYNYWSEELEALDKIVWAL